MGKKFENLDVIDDFMITALASDPEVGEEVSRLLVSTLLQRKVGKVYVTSQRVISSPIPNLRGIRMDVEVEEVIEGAKEKDTDLNVYDIEPHLQKGLNLPRHNRFYQAKIDSRRMKAGENNFNKLPNLFVITILNYDFFNKDYMMYTFKNQCIEEPDIEYNDGLKFIYFYTGGSKGGTPKIKNFLNYLAESTLDNVKDEATKAMHEYMQKVKTLPEVRDSYMTWDLYIEMMKEQEREAERAECQIIIDEKDKELTETNSKLTETNSKLTETNSKLTETNTKLTEAQKEIERLKAQLAMQG